MNKQKIKPLTEHDLQEGRDILLIEEVTSRAELSLIRRQAIKDGLIVIMAVSERMNKNQTFLELAQGNSVRQFCWHFASFAERYRAEDQSYQSVDKVYGLLEKTGKIPVHPLERLYDDTDVKLVFKKELIGKICQYYRVTNAVLSVNKRGHHVLLAPTLEFRNMHRLLKEAGEKTLDEKLIKKMKCVFSKTVQCMDQFREKVVALLQLACIVPWVLTRIRKVRLHRCQPKEYRLAIRFYKRGWGIKTEEQHADDWLIDNDRFNSGNTLIVAETPLIPEDIEGIKRRNYQRVDQYRQEAFREVSLPFILQNLLVKGVTCAVPLLMRSCFSPTYLVRVAVTAWIDFLRWQVFLEKFRPKSYFGCHDIFHGHIFRNILLKKAGCETWYFDHSNSKIQMYETGPGISGREALRAYINFDHEIHWGDQLIELEKMQHNGSRSFHAFGPIWIDDVKGTKVMDEILHQRWNNTKETFIIAAFATTNSMDAINGEKVHRSFLKTLENLIENQARVIFKPKLHYENYMGSEGTDIKEVFARLKANPNFIFLNQNVAFNNVIYYSDFVISMAFASTTVESILARKRSLYYDATNSYPHSYFEKFPRLVAHSEEQLRELMEYWRNLPENDFERYIEEYILPEYGGRLTKPAKDLIRDAVYA